MVKNIIKFNFLRSHVVNQNEIKYSIVNTHYQDGFYVFLLVYSSALTILLLLFLGWLCRIKVTLTA